MGAVPGFIEIESIVQRLMPEVRQDRHPPAQERLSVLVDARRPGKGVIGGMVVVHRQGNLLEIVDALGASGGVEADPNRRQQDMQAIAPVTAGELIVGIASRWVSTAPSPSTVTVVEDGNSRPLTSSIVGIVSGSSRK